MPPPRHKRDSENLFDTRTTPEEIRYLTQLLAELASWDPTNNTTQRKKRFIPLFASIGAAVGSIVNAGQIKKIKKNIAILQEATILQDQQIMELARYADLTAARVRLHDTQIYRLQYGLLVVERWYQGNDRCEQFSSLYQLSHCYCTDYTLQAPNRIGQYWKQHW